MGYRAPAGHRHRTPFGAMASALLALAPLALAAQSEPHSEPDAISQLPPGPGEPLPAPDALEAEGAVIGEIRIVVGDIFDTRIPGERAWLYRTANKLHIETRENTIRDQLLFKPGEPYRTRVIEETERLLRANGYLYSAEIEPVALPRRGGRSRRADTRRVDAQPRLQLQPRGRRERGRRPDRGAEPAGHRSAGERRLGRRRRSRGRPVRLL